MSALDKFRDSLVKKGKIDPYNRNIQIVPASLLPLRPDTNIKALFKGVDTLDESTLPVDEKKCCDEVKEDEQVRETL